MLKHLNVKHSVKSEEWSEVASSGRSLYSPRGYISAWHAKQCLKANKSVLKLLCSVGAARITVMFSRVVCSLMLNLNLTDGYERATFLSVVIILLVYFCLIWSIFIILVSECVK